MKLMRKFGVISQTVGKFLAVTEINLEKHSINIKQLKRWLDGGVLNGRA